MRSKDHEVLPECPGRLHNSHRAAHPRSIDGVLVEARCICPGADEIRCICPGADEIRKQSIARLKQVKRSRSKEIRIGNLPTWERKASAPFDYAGGLCTTPEGRKIAFKGFNTFVTLAGIKARQEAKDQCEACPILRACTANLRVEEADSPGKLGGVYAGMDSFERQGRRLVWVPEEGHVVEIPMGVMA